jgi:hypothetical protein
MSRAERLALRGRKAAERLMVDTCTVKRPADAVTTNASGVVAATSTTIYTGKCKIQQQRMQFAEMTDAGDHRFTVAPLEVHLPTSATGIDTNDRIEITASFDTANVGRVFTVRTFDRKTFQTALRVIVTEVTA